MQTFRDFVRNKLNPVQPTMSHGGTKSEYPAPPPVNIISSIQSHHVLSRCFNMIVDDVATIEYEVLDQKKISNNNSLIRPDTIHTLLNTRINPFQSAEQVKRDLVSDFIIHGNAYLVFDGEFLYYVPAEKVAVHSHETKYISHYEVNGARDLKPSEVIHIRDNNIVSNTIGKSKASAISDLITLYNTMKSYQQGFFLNDAQPGIVLEHPSPLTEKQRERALERWKNEYNPKSGARKPAILDGGMSIANLGKSTFKELDFETSITKIEEQMALAMGVPPILMNGGNNANINPNLRLYYLETIVPICNKMAAAFTAFFGYKIAPILVNVPALQPDLKELANYVSTLVNGGIITPDEGRAELGYGPLEETELRIPANIAGSAIDSTQGGRPTEE